MKQRKCVTGAPNAWKSPAHDFRPFVADTIDPGYNDPLSKINNMLYRSRVETWMEETGCTYTIISGLVGKKVTNFADLQALTDSQIEKLCNTVRINKDYFYHKNKSYRLLYQQPMMFTTKEDGSVTEKKAVFSLEERKENMKTPEGQVMQYMTEYFDLHAAGQTVPCTTVVAGFKDFREKNKLDPFNEGKILPMILELGYRRRFVLEGNKIIPSINGIKLKHFVKNSSYVKLSTRNKDEELKDEEMNLMWFDRILSRIESAQIDPIKLMKWVGRSATSKYNIVASNWVYKGFTQNIAWILKTTPDYLIGKTDDPYTGADKVNGNIGRLANPEWFVLMDGSLLKDVTDDRIVRCGIPEYMVQYIRTGKRVVLKEVALRISRTFRVAEDKLIDSNPEHFPESDPSLLTDFRKITKEEKQQKMGGNLAKIKKAASVEVIAPKVEPKPLESAEVTATAAPDTKTGLKRFCDDYLSFTKSGNDMIFARPLYDLYETYCDKYHYAHKMYSEFTGYIRSRGGREKQTPEGQDLFARVSSNSLLQLIYKGPKQNPKKTEETAAPVVEEIKTEVKMEVKNAETPNVVETEKKLDISFDTRHIMTLIDSATEEEIEDLEKQMDTVTASIDKLREYIKLARMIKSMKENAYS